MNDGAPVSTRLRAALREAQETGTIESWRDAWGGGYVIDACGISSYFEFGEAAAFLQGAAAARRAMAA